MSRETIDAKAARLLTTGAVRLLVLDVDGHGRASVVGDHGTYDVELDGRARPRCSCPSWGQGRCSHARAVALVVQADAKAASDGT